MKQTVDQVFTTQNGIGRYYARVKIFKRAGIEKAIDDKNLDKKDLKKLREYIEKLFDDRLPAVISPDGKTFIIDGHHDLYGAVLAELDFHETKVKLEIVKDYSEENFSQEDFVKDMIDREWADKEALTGPPKLISDIANDVERSLSGLALFEIAKEYEIPFIGKNFIPRVQFELMDLVREKKLFDFDGNLTKKNINAFANLIISHKIILEFWIKSLKPEAPKSLAQFLEKQLELSQVR